ncbi:TPA: hypothetical protein L6A17_13780 [Pseudomonas aeruginosa]|nr:hypothetical protein HV98_31845 [Pseudomonas aeruginosa]EAZ54941.1 hypothetical protein PACG_03578 [Pseudomonas aeruginosa C3719]AYZ87602.1 hypothetical protein EGY27_33695 [Pseudomonas aeruginosa]KAA5657215.1 hypothetical protein F3G58_22965 [Pseudomonas aeruginosa]KJC20214.1 hypothetical protein TO65_08760 [Pseudomonas aeruginosa]
MSSGSTSTTPRAWLSGSVVTGKCCLLVIRKGQRPGVPFPAPCASGVAVTGRPPCATGGRGRTRPPAGVGEDTKGSCGKGNADETPRRHHGGPAARKAGRATGRSERGHSRGTRPAELMPIPRSPVVVALGAFEISNES